MCGIKAFRLDDKRKETAPEEESFKLMMCFDVPPAVRFFTLCQSPNDPSSLAFMCGNGLLNDEPKPPQPSADELKKPSVGSGRHNSDHTLTMKSSGNWNKLATMLIVVLSRDSIQALKDDNSGAEKEKRYPNAEPTCGEVWASTRFCIKNECCW